MKNKSGYASAKTAKRAWLNVQKKLKIGGFAKNKGEEGTPTPAAKKGGKKRKATANDKEDGDSEDRFDAPPAPKIRRKARLAGQKKPRSSAPSTFIKCLMFPKLS